MKALTLLRPWAYCVTHLGKRIENRTWPPYREIVGARIAIHSGKGLDESGMQWLLREGFVESFPQEARIAGAIVATAVVEGYMLRSNDKWFTGPIGWVLRDVIVLPSPVICRGAQGLWDVPQDVVMQCLSRDMIR